MKLKDISELLGFTRTEITVLFFLIIIFFTGFLARIFNADKLQSQNYDYSLSDSLFLSVPDESESQMVYSDNQADYQKKDLEVNSTVFRKSKNALPTEKSIDLNIASLGDLMQLPGVGEKTAQKIIALRNEKGGFDSVEEIKEVKGIGTKKFEQIKRYIFVAN